MALTSIVTPERTVDNKGRIKVEAEDNAMVLMDHGDGVMSHVQCGFNYFDPYGHEGKGQQQHTITVWGTHGNMGLVGYDWAPFGVDLATRIMRRRSDSFQTLARTSGSRAPAWLPNHSRQAPSR